MEDAESLDPRVSVIGIAFYDSKYYAVSERVVSVSYESESGNLYGTIAADGSISDTGNKVTVEWVSKNPDYHPDITHGNNGSSFYSMEVLPGSFTGKFTVVTDRYTYVFTRGVAVEAGKISFQALDFASPDVQPVRKVGVLGDSISTFDGALCSREYSPWYPSSDPNVGTNSSIAVDSKTKTYWWKVIYEQMKAGTLDVNSSWSGTKVIHEIKAGRISGNSLNAGFVDRAYDFKDPDIILIHGGTNDKGHSTPLGNYDYDKSVDQLDDACFRSAYVKLVKMLQKHYSGVQIIIIIGDALSGSYEQSVIAIAGHFGIPYVSFAGDTIPKARGSHPNATGHQQMADKIYSVCKDYLP